MNSQMFMYWKATNWQFDGNDVFHMAGSFLDIVHLLEEHELSPATPCQPFRKNLYAFLIFVGRIFSKVSSNTK